MILLSDPGSIECKNAIWALRKMRYRKLWSPIGRTTSNKVMIPWWVKIKLPKLHFFIFYKKYLSYDPNSINFWKYNVLGFSGMFSHHFWTIFDDFEIWWKKSFSGSNDSLGVCLKGRRFEPFWFSKATVCLSISFDWCAAWP